MSHCFNVYTQPSRTEFGLMVKYYGRRGDMHRARETFERMRARGIIPTSRIYTRYILLLQNVLHFLFRFCFDKDVLE